MKKIYLLGMMAAFAISANAQRNCGTMEHHAKLESADPKLQGVREQIEQQTAAFVENFHDGMGEVAVTIPVVVHVVYNNSTENISDARINEQIAVLNEDFRKLNADRTLVPSAWSSVAADFEINFCLASVDPSGAATTGITRTSSTVTSFTDDDAMKFNASGGKDIWDRSKYLNIWVCDLSGSLLGYAQFPGGPASTDGVVIDYAYFGKTGASAPFNKGRTATHEVGHWLNLYHIWGDDAGACSGSDAVTDTPNQADATSGCPGAGTVRTDACTASSPGIMWMNYMDYTDDACMYMFTTGQKARAQALFATGGARVSLLTSNGCGGSASYCTATGGTAYEYINRVQLGSVINNLSGNNTGYGNYTSTAYNVTRGTAYTLTLTPGFVSTAYNEYWKVYIDYNNDLDFVDAGEEVYSGGPSSAAVSGSFTIPAGTSTGNRRMRVRMSDAAITSPCGTMTYGETEDYTLNIQAAASCGNPSALTSSSITSSGATLSWTAVAGATSYNIQYKVNGGATWTTTTSTTNSRVLTGLTAATTYNWQVQAVCSGGNSSYVAGTNFTTLTATCTDSYEANETNATAKTISVNTNALAKICTATDVDWYKFTTTSAAPKVKVTLTTLPADYDVYLYNSAGTTLLGSGTNGGTTSETIIYNTPTAAATYSIRVIGYNGAFNTTSSYTLRASTQSAAWRTSGEPDETTPKEDVLSPATDFLMAYPNPTSGELNLNYVSSQSGDAIFSVYDLMGRRIVSFDRIVDLGENHQMVDLSNVQPGVYFVRVTTELGVQTVKVQVSR